MPLITPALQQLDTVADLNRPLVFNGTKVVPGVGSQEVLATISTTTTVVNTIAETDLFSFTIPQNGVRAGDELVLTLWGDMLNNTGSTSPWFNYLKLGGTTVLTMQSASLGSSGNRRPFRSEIRINIRNPASEQWATWDIGIGTATTAGLVSGWGDEGWGVNSAAVNFTTAARTISVTLIHSSANANLDQRVLGGSLVRRSI